MSKEKVGMYSEQVRGVSYKESDIHDSLNDQSVTLLRANNIFDNELNFDNVVYIDKSRVSDKQYLRKGDIVVCASSGSKNLVGKAAQVDFDTEVTFGAFLKVVRPKNIIPKYLGYYFLSNEYRRTISSISEGANINNIRNEHIDDLLISIVDNDTQKMQSEILDKVYGILKRKKQQLTEYDQLIKSRFVELFGDPLKNTKNFDINNCKKLLTKIGSGATPSGGNESYIDAGISLIRSMNVYNNRFDFEGLAHISEDQAYQLKNVTVEPNDVLVNITGASVTRCCKVPNNVLPARVNQHVSILRCGNRIIPDFLEYLFTNDTFQQYLMSLAISNGATREAITKQQIEKIEIICPPVTLQNKFANFVQQVDKLKFAVQKSIDETQKLFDSLMQEYFG